MEEKILAGWERMRGNKWYERENERENEITERDRKKYIDDISIYAETKEVEGEGTFRRTLNKSLEKPLGSRAPRA